MYPTSEPQWVGLDIGTVRCGVAVADKATRMALPLCVLAAQPASTLAPRLLAALGERTVRALVCGLPLDQHGNAGTAAQAVRQIAEALAAELGLELHFIDERYTTSAVARPPKVKSRAKSPRSAPPDAQAAALILQAFLDSHAG
jgi:putative holliday junction resolvase